ncbi:MAG: SGNH/GDSL hydrolase family protein [Candidatus Poribacteria bacterium]
MIERFFPRYEIVRQMLLGSNSRQIIHTQNSIGQAYLLYIPAPNFSKHGSLQHNEQGYRGAAVPLNRAPGKLRILFLGGSTTYGLKVPNPDETYPAQIGRILEQMPEGKNGVEIINGGLTWGTTAEITTHFLFKYRYYQPDIVVLNTGANDAQGSIRPFYHPDYSHWRHTLPKVWPLPAMARWITHSRFVALFSIRVFYSEVARDSHFVHKYTAPPARWYTNVHRDAADTLRIPEEDLAFKNNLRTIIREVKAEGAELLLVPFRAKPDNKFGDRLLAETARNETILRQLATEFGIDLAPFPSDVISSQNWADSMCHLNAAGSQEKARHVMAYLLPIVRRMVAKGVARK